MTFKNNRAPDQCKLKLPISFHQINEMALKLLSGNCKIGANTGTMLADNGMFNGMLV